MKLFTKTITANDDGSITEEVHLNTPKVPRPDMGKVKEGAVNAGKATERGFYRLIWNIIIWSWMWIPFVWIGYEFMFCGGFTNVC